MPSLRLPKDFVVIGFIPYYAKLKNSQRPPEPIAKARTSAEAVRYFAKLRHCPSGSIVQIFTPETLLTGKAYTEHRLKEYRRPRVR